MSVWQLNGIEGDLLSIRVTVEAFLLEHLLEALAEAPFPVNPEIQHHVPMEREGHTVPGVQMEFPVWRSQMAQLRDLFARQSFSASFSVRGMLCSIGDPAAYSG
ncbi:MAG TPA: hypothetical protein VM120_08690 [Bryobacteraceae bacterium]|nr:hypothetical protein [Bryobacteraceae bacterium]